MKSTKMLAKLSSRLMNSSSLVVPFPIQSSFNQHLTSNLKTLLSSLIDDGNNRTTNYLNVNFLVQALDFVAATQKLAHESITRSSFRDSDCEPIERYLDDNNIVLLDACNVLGDKLDNVCKYVKSLRLALHLLEGGFIPPSSLARANKLLESIRLTEREDKKTTKFASTQHRIKTRARRNKYDVVSELEEILDGSSIVTSTICEILENAMSFKLKHGYTNNRATFKSPSYTWLSSLQEMRNSIKKDTKKSLLVWELQKTVRLAQELRQELRCEDYSEISVRVEELKRSCDELENGVKVVEGKVKEVYRYLMCVRMELLGKLSSMA